MTERWWEAAPLADDVEAPAAVSPDRWWEAAPLAEDEDEAGKWWLAAPLAEPEDEAERLAAEEAAAAEARASTDTPFLREQSGASASWEPNNPDQRGASGRWDAPPPSRFDTATSHLGRSAINVVADISKGIGLTQATAPTKALETFARIDADPEADIDLSDVPFNVWNDAEIYRRFPDRRADLKAKYAGQPTKVEDKVFYKAGQAITDVAEGVLPVNPEYKDEFWASKLPSGLGSTLGFAATGIVARGLKAPMTPTVAATGAAVGGVDQFEDAMGKGASLEDALRASRLGGALGTTEAIPITSLLDRLDKVSGGTVKTMIKEVIKQGTEEAIQEFVQTVGSNLVANKIVAYDPERGTFTGSGEAAGVGFTVGGLMQFAVGLVTGRRGGMGPSEDAGQPARPPITPPTAEDEASPIPTEMIQRGKQAVADRLAGIEPAPVPEQQAAEPAAKEEPEAPTLAEGYEPLFNEAGEVMGSFNAKTGDVKRAAPAEAEPDLTAESYVDDYLAGKGRGDTEADRAYQQFAANNADAIEAEFQRRQAEPAAAPAAEPWANDPIIEEAPAVAAQQPLAGEPAPAGTAAPAPEMATQRAAEPVARRQLPDGKIDARVGDVVATTNGKGRFRVGYATKVDDDGIVTEMRLVDGAVQPIPYSKRVSVVPAERLDMAAVDTQLRQNDRFGDRAEMQETLRPFIRQEGAPATTTTTTPATIETLNKSTSVIRGDVDVARLTEALGRKPLFNQTAQAYVIPTAKVEQVRAALPDVFGPVETGAVEAPSAATTKPIADLTADDVASRFAAAKTSDEYDNVRMELWTERPDLQNSIVAALDNVPRPPEPVDEAEVAQAAAADAVRAEKARQVADYVASGGKVTFRTYTKIVPISDPRTIRVGTNGLYVSRGKNWDYLIDSQLDTLVSQIPKSRRTQTGAAPAPDVTNPAIIKQPDQPVTSTFDPTTKLPEARAYVGAGKSVKIPAVAKALGLGEMDARRVMTALAQEQGSGVRINNKGEPARIPTSTRPKDLRRFAAEMGGIRDDEGHDLKKGRNLSRLIPGAGPLIRPKGNSLDRIGEAAYEAGYFRERPTVDEVLQALERDNFYVPEEGAAFAAEREAKDDEQTTKQRREDIKAVAKTKGELLKTSDIDAIAESMASTDMDADEAVSEYIYDLTMRAANALEADTGDARYDDQTLFDDIPFDDGQAEPRASDRDDGARGEGRAREAGDAPEGGARGADAAQDRGPLTDTVQTVDGAREQGRMFTGAEDRATPPRVQARAPQRAADEGLFGARDEAVDDEPPLFSRRQSPFYSAALRAAENLPQAKGNGLQMLALLRKQPGVKEEEIAWLDLVGFLGDRKGVTREELADYIRANQVQVQEVERGESTEDLATLREAGWVPDWNRETGGVDGFRYIGATPPGGRPEPLSGEAAAAATRIKATKKTKYREYTIPGAENYRELLLTLPAKEDVRRAQIEAIQDRFERGEDRPGDQAEFERLTAEVPTATEDYRTSHFDEANILAHVRFNDRLGPNGEKVLFIEEIQSDWHQAGRKKGYRTAPAWTAFEQKGYRVEQDGAFWMVYEPGGDPVSEGRTRQEAIDDLVRRDTENVTPAGAMSESGVPDAPLKKTWHEMAFRRMVAYAAEGGYDAVAWPGDANAVASVERWGDLETVTNDAGEVSHFRGNDNMTAIVNRYLVDLPRYANKWGKRFGGKVDGSVISYTEDQGTQEYAGPTPSWADVLDVQTATNARGTSWESPITGERQDYVIERVDNGNRMNKIVQAIRDGASFQEAMAIHGATDLAKIFGGRMEVIPTLDQKKTFSFPITPEMRDTVKREGVPLFKRPDAALTETFTSKADAVYQDLRAEMDRVGLAKVDLRVENSIFSNGKTISFSARPDTDQIDGFFWRNTIGVALDALAGARFTLNHEIIHGLRSSSLWKSDYGLFRRAEWDTLERAARADRGRMREVRNRYADLTDAQQIEEAIADMYADWVAGRMEARGFIRTAFERIKAFFEALGNALRGNGFQTAADVFARIESGEVGARQNGTMGEGGDVQFSRGQTETDAFKRWFGDSKVVDADGKPLVVYHGTNSPEFSSFDPKLVGKGAGDWSGKGYYFTPDDLDALGYGERVIPAYVKIDRPFIKYLSDYNWRAPDDFSEYLKKQGYDGVIVRVRDIDDVTGEVAEDWIKEIVAFSPNQIKSATGNRGTFDPADDRIAFSRRDNDLFRGNYGAPQRNVAESLLKDTTGFLQNLSTDGRQALGESFDRWRFAFQDRFVDLKRIQGEIAATLGRSLRAGENPYQAEELMTGKVGARMERLSEDMVAPLVQAIATRLGNKSVTIGNETLSGVALVDKYLYARHAPERNARIAEINPKFKPGEGSGMTDAEAVRVMDAIRRAGLMPDVETVAKQIDAMVEFSVQTRQDAGLLSKEQADAWRAQYRHYVPLRGFAELDPELADERPNVGGSGLTVKGAESKRAFGRTSKAADIVAHVISQAQEAIVRAERNEVGRALFNLVSQMPNPDLWEANKVDMRPTWNEKSQQVEYRPVTPIFGADADYTVTLKIDGKEHRVTFNRDNAKARRLADSFRNLSGQDFAWIVRNVGWVNRFLSKVNTSYNPAFVITNAFRDIQTGLVNLAQYDMPGLVSGTFRDYLPAMKASVDASLFNKEKGEWGRWYREYVEAGGRVYFNRVENIKDLQAKLQRELQAATTGPGLRKALHTVGNFVERGNQGIEGAIRLAAYKNARERGMSKTDAASLAKNLTVNFNRRGKYGPVMNSLFLFYNAGIQGTATMLGAMKSPRVRKILAGIAGFAGALTVYNLMAGGDDDDGERFYDKIPEFEKERNLIIMMPDGSGRYAKIPLPYGYNLFHGLGRNATELVWGKEPSEVVASIATTFVGSFNPIGGSNNIGNFLAPTIIDPVVDLELTNRNFADAPIRPEQTPFEVEKPDAQLYWPSVSPLAKWVTDFLTEITGGDDVVAGAIDVSPETVEYLWGTLTGAAGSFWGDKVIGTVLKFSDPTADVEINDIPFVRNIAGAKSDWVDRTAFYDRSAKIDLVVDQIDKYRESGRAEKAAELRREHAQILPLAGLAKSTKRTLSDIRKRRAEMLVRKDEGKILPLDYKAEIDRLKEQEKRAETRFNAAWNDAKKGQ